MPAKKSKVGSKPSLKKSSTMAATANAGQEFLKRTWGEEKLNKVNNFLEQRDKKTDGLASSSSSVDSNPATTAATTTGAASSASTSATSKTTKPKLAKTNTMRATAKEAKSLLGTGTLGDTRSETKRRKAAEDAKKALKEVHKKPAAVAKTKGKKAPLKRLGTMPSTAREGKAYVKRQGGRKGKRSSAARKGKGRK